MPVIIRDTSQARFSFQRTLADQGPIVVRSDGKSYRLEAADRLVLFPAKCANTGELSSIGFWYAHKKIGPKGVMNQG